jgi:hypothetical protein
MREIIFKCDRCGRTIDKPVRIEAWYVNRTGNLTEKAYIFNGEESNELDLCEGCAKVLNDFIYPPEEEAEEIPEQDPEEDEDPFVPKKLTDKLKKDLVKEKKPHPTKKKLDIGKIRALRDAGWSLKKIADEMGVGSPQTIANHLKEVEG